ncbi:hypothetical protein IMG5_156200 [Ichthyophthirius multifiliis]|uniref:3-hydroxyisobutyryl-CoA hydrolase n=1 Tax=Ichthyophthirius multifiliis TaxID=5932 RepID=G0QZE9_ICHMU|nr:hypothetical protein IMG5_156200 [Ichthyophthirius multifiliis]EGR29402.1 hypothetical protein IMG5_156200 [Ichthyophthirius multifiliis]|eukprot:XP_004030638.1 hypothetical protein IMG5_156200 [Ichthyophthirius multifiliis]
MIRSIQNKIEEWTNKNIKAVWIQGTGGKAFCAGGDIRSLYDAKIQGDIQIQKILVDFFKEEFTLDYSLAVMKPTQISVMDGIVMGGGVGISVHSPIKIATENSVFAMPEAKIGFFTDVGGGFFLSKLRNNIGLYLGLSGARLKGKELVSCGIANFFVQSKDLENLEKEVSENLNDNTSTEDIKQIVKKYSLDVEKIIQNEFEIKTLFQGNTLQNIINNIKQSDSEFAKQTLKNLQQQNAISLRIIFEQISRGAKMSLKENLIQDFALSQSFLKGNDFFEGIRTVLIDRNDQPKWTYQSPFDVPQSLIDDYFQPLPPQLQLQL